MSSGALTKDVFAELFRVMVPIGLSSGMCGTFVF
jgi:hypothetical protein